jgi:hypothetical protein
VAGFETEHVALELWRAVEAQHRVSTMVLVDTLDEQALLERILDDSKPALQNERRLHYLLFTPFRYPPLPAGSRFRGPGDPGVFYGAEETRTACAELGFWRWKFLRESPQLNALAPTPQTLFRTAVRGETIDLRRPPLSRRRRQWSDPDDYRACQQLAREAREQGIAIVRYQSVRDPRQGACAAVLSHAAFTYPKPIEEQVWTIAVFPQRVFWRRDSVFEDASFEFDTQVWTGDQAGKPS